MPADYSKFKKDNSTVEQIRTFIAIELPEEVKEYLVKLQDNLKAIDPRCAKWVNPDSIHLTLKFLGNVDTEKLDSIINVMEGIARNTAPFELAISELGAFPNLKRVQIVWVGIDAKMEQLRNLQNDLDTRLVKIGFPGENRSFVPHLTLARVKEHVSPMTRLALGEAIAQTKLQQRLIIPVSSFKLIRSQLSREGAIYTPLYSAELKP